MKQMGLQHSAQYTHTSRGIPHDAFALCHFGPRHTTAELLRRGSRCCTNVPAAQYPNKLSTTKDLIYCFTVAPAAAPRIGSRTYALQHFQRALRQVCRSQCFQKQSGAAVVPLCTKRPRPVVGNEKTKKRGGKTARPRILRRAWKDTCLFVL